MLYRRLRYLFRLYFAFLIKYKIWIFYSIVSLVLLISLPPAIIKHLPKYRSTQVIGLIGRYNITNLPLSIQKKISLGLTTLDPQGNPSPGLASSWTATNGGLLYNFTIDHNLKWSNGKSIQSSDLVFNFSDATVTYPDKNTLQIKLDKFSFSPLPVLVSKPIFKAIPIKWPKNIPYLGAGTYNISSFNQQGDALTEIVLMPTNLNSSLPKLKYRFYSNQSQALTAFKLGEINSLENISDFSDLQSWGNILITENPNYDKIIAVIFNYKGKYVGGSNGRNFRLLLNYATDKSTFPFKAIGPISSNSWAFSDKLKSSVYDPEKAALMLKRIENPPQSLTLHTFPGLIKTAEKLKTDWGKIGLKIEIVSTTEIPSDFEAMVMPLPIFADPDQYHLWHSKSESQNYGSFNNPRIDKLLEDGRRELDPAKRKVIYEDFQKYLLDESPAIFLYYPVTYTISKT